MNKYSVPVCASVSQETGAIAGEQEDLPEWNLHDLYPGVDSQEYKDDLAYCREKSKAFEAVNSGKLADILRKNPRDLSLVIAEYEMLEERMGRIISYAGLLYASDTTNPEFAKFYGDAQEEMTMAGSHLLFFTLELNRLDDNELKQAVGKDVSLAYYEPWLSDLRKDKPYQLDDNIEQLFHEKSVTGRAAWNRLFDETMSGLEFTVDGETVAVEQALSLLQDPSRAKRKAGAEEIARVLNENIRSQLLEWYPDMKEANVVGSWMGIKEINPDVTPKPPSFSQLERTRPMRGENLGHAYLYETDEEFPSGEWGYLYWDALEQLKSQGVKHIGNSHNASINVDVITLQALRVSSAIPLFMVVKRNFGPELEAW